MVEFFGRLYIVYGGQSDKRLEPFHVDAKLYVDRSNNMGRERIGPDKLLLSLLGLGDI